MAKEWDRESVNAADIPEKEDSSNVQLGLAEEESDGINHKIEENAEDIQMSETGEEEGSSYSQVKKVLGNEDLEEFNSSIAAGCQDRTKGIEKVVDETLRKTTEKVEVVETSDSALDALSVVEEAALKLYEYINHIFSMLEDGLTEDLRIDHLYQALAQNIEKVTEELLRIKNDEYRNKGFPQDLIQLRDLSLDIPERLTGSFEPGDSSSCPKRFTENELSSCKVELNQSKDDLRAIILMARELKKKEMARKCTEKSSNQK